MSHKEEHKTNHGDSAQKPDPWHKDNITTTIEKRRIDQRNLINVVQAMDSQLVYEVTSLLKGNRPGPARWELIDQEHPDYDKDLAAAVLKKVDDVYSLGSPLHPLRDVIDKAKLEKNYFNERLVQGLYFKHVVALKRNVGAKDYMGVMKSFHENNLETVVKETQQQAVADLDSDKHGDYILDFLKSEYRFDEKKVSADRLKLRLGEEMLAHFAGERRDKDYFHRTYKNYNKKEEPAGAGHGGDGHGH